MKVTATCEQCQDEPTRVPNHVRKTTCRTCRHPMHLVRTATRNQRKRMKALRWQPLEDTASLVAFMESKGISAVKVLDQSTALGRDLAHVLSQTRPVDGVSLFTKSFANKPGLRSGDFGTKWALLTALRKASEPTKTMIRSLDEPDSQSAQGQLIEQEVAWRANKIGTLFNFHKAVQKITHPLLGVELHVSADGSCIHGQRLPMELKTKNSLTRISGLTRTLHQIALQALAFGKNDAVLVYISRLPDESGQHRQVALLVHDIVEWHLSQVKSWLEDPEFVEALDGYRAFVSSTLRHNAASTHQTEGVIA